MGGEMALESGRRREERACVEKESRDAANWRQRHERFVSVPVPGVPANVNGLGPGGGGAITVPPSTTSR